MSDTVPDQTVAAFTDAVVDSPTIDAEVSNAVQDGTLTPQQADEVLADQTIVHRRLVQRM